MKSRAATQQASTCSGFPEATKHHYSSAVHVYICRWGYVFRFLLLVNAVGESGISRPFSKRSKNANSSSEHYKLFIIDVLGNVLIRLEVRHTYGRLYAYTQWQVCQHRACCMFAAALLRTETCSHCTMTYACCECEIKYWHNVAHVKTGVGYTGSQVR